MIAEWMIAEKANVATGRRRKVHNRLKVIFPSNQKTYFSLPKYDKTGLYSSYWKK